MSGPQFSCLQTVVIIEENNCLFKIRACHRIRKVTNEEKKNYYKKLQETGGVVVMPKILQVRRVPPRRGPLRRVPDRRTLD